MLNTASMVYIVHGDAALCERIEELAYATGWRASTFASAEEFLSRPRASCPSCLIVDVMLPGLSGLDLQQRIADDPAKMPIIFITSCTNISITVRAMKAGAIEFLSSPFKTEVLLEAIRSALDRSQAGQVDALETKTLRDRYDTLSGRERDVMRLVVSGLMNKQVGGELGICEITVKAHRGRVMQKMKAGSLAGLVNIATRLAIPPQRLYRPAPPSTASLQNVESRLGCHGPTP
jgi:FixJ family two-component response regulator